MKQTLKSLARRQCCNFVETSCLGVDLDAYMFNKDGECLILQDKTCAFFSLYVLPLESGLIKVYKTMSKRNNISEKNAQEGV